MHIIHLASLALSANVAYAQNYGTGKFYINSLLNPHLCVRDCEPGGPLDSPDSICGGIVTEGWITLHQTVDDCCNYQLRWMDLAVCKDKANPNINGSTKWWADNDDGTCYRDCDPSTSPDCKRVPPPIVLYDSASICCSVSLPWADPKFCNSRAVDTTSGGWIIDWYNQKCTQDCQPSDGPPCQAHDKPETKIFDTPQQCCSAIFWVDSNICVADSLHIDSFTNKWYVDYLSQTCVKDCDASSGLPCKGNPAADAFLFSSALECCSAKLFWVAPSSCAGFSDGSDSTYQVTPTVASLCPAPYDKVATHYVSGDQVTWNGQIYECITSNGRCFQDGYEPWSSLTAGVWNIVGPCPSKQVTPTTASPTRSPAALVQPTTTKPTANAIIQVPTLSPTIDTPFIFEGIDDAESVFRGELDLLWDYPTDDMGVIVDLTNVNYHVFSVVGIFDYEAYLQTSTLQDLITEFEQRSVNENSIQYHLVPDGEESEITLNTTHYGELHSLLVVAEVDGIFSHNFETTEIHASSEDPVVRDDINIVGIFIPTNNLTIVHDKITDVLTFDGLVRDEHKNLAVGDYVIGVTTSSSMDFFCLEVLDVIELSAQKVVLRTNVTQLEQIFQSLDYQTSMSVSRPNKVLNVTSNQRYRHLIKKRATRKLRFLRKLGRWVKKTAKSVGKAVKTVTGFIGDKVTGIVNFATDVVKLVVNVITGKDADITFERKLIDINLGFDWKMSPTASTAAKMYVRSSIYVRIQISKTQGTRVEAGWIVSYGADFEMNLQGSLDFTGKKRIWTGPKKYFVFVVVVVPVLIDVGPKVDMVLTAKGPTNNEKTSMKVGATGSGKTSAYCSTRAGCGTEYKPPSLVPYFKQDLFGDGSEYILSVALEPAIEIRLYAGALSGGLGISAGVTMTTKSENYNIGGSPFLALAKADIDFDFGVFVDLSSYFDSNWNPRATIFKQSWPLIALPKGEIRGGNHFCDEDAAVADDIHLQNLGNPGILNNGFFPNSITWFVEDQTWKVRPILNILLDTNKNEVKLIKEGFSSPMSLAAGKIYAIVRPRYPFFLPVVYSAELGEIVSSVVGCAGNSIEGQRWWASTRYPASCKLEPVSPQYSGTTLYDSLDSCCEVGLPQIEANYCKHHSVGLYTDGWYFDPQFNKCVKDCNPASPLLEDCDPASRLLCPTYRVLGYSKKYGSVDECCAENLSSLGTDCKKTFLQPLGITPKVVTLGDSYSAGVGLYQLGNQYDVEHGGTVGIDTDGDGIMDKKLRITGRQKDDLCWRETDDLAGSKYANMLQVPSVSYACMGATLVSRDETNNEEFRPFANQIEYLNSRPEHKTDKCNGWEGSTILFTIGGNDVETLTGKNWPDLVKSCITSLSCQQAVKNGIGNWDEVKKRLDDAYKTLASVAHRATIRVLGYPRLFQPATPLLEGFVEGPIDISLSCPGVTGINVGEAEYFDEMVDILNAIIATAVDKVKMKNPALDIKFVSMDNYITKGACRLWGHEINDKVCSFSDNTDLCFDITDEDKISYSSFHPSRAGYTKYEDAFFDSL